MVLLEKGMCFMLKKGVVREDTGDDAVACLR